MNKLSKGLIAAGAATVLLLGTGGTLAYWNAQANLGSASISSGNLALVAQNGTGTWTLQHSSQSTPTTVDITTAKIVPGDKLTYQAAFTVTAQGNNLAFEVGVTPGAIQGTAASGAQKTINDALAARLTGTAATSFTVTKGTGGGTITPTTTVPSTGKAQVFHLDGASGTYLVNTTVTITWPFGDATSPALDNAAKLGQVDLSQFTASVTQIDNTTKP